MPDTTGPRWATINQAADYANIPRRTLRRWVNDGTLPAHRLGPRKIQVNLDDLDRMRSPVRKASRWLTPADEQLAREVAAALLPLADWQKEKLSLLLSPGGHHA
jgi:excisionase family DNA binding protein